MSWETLQNRLISFCYVVIALSFFSPSLSGEEQHILRGEWFATSGPNRLLHGRWIGEALPGHSNSLHGSWTLSNEAGKTLLSGTWAARKTGQGWLGTWFAEDRFQRTRSGTWKADAKDFSARTLQELFSLTAQRDITGSWRSSRLQGQWRLRSSRPIGRSE